MTFYHRLCRWRTWIMGAAMLWIMLYHSGLKLPSFPLWALKEAGYGGVDFFLFLSGFGVAHSLAKDGDPLRFFKRRVARLLPAYLPVILLWMGWMFLHNGMTLSQVIGNLTMTGSLFSLDGQFNWYFSGLLAFYFVAPLCAVWMRRHGHGVRGWIGMTVFCSLLCITAFRHDTLIIVTRFPLFLLGFGVAVWDWAKRPLSRLWLAVAVALMVTGIVALGWLAYLPRPVRWAYGLWWYPFILIVPATLFWATALLERLDRFGWFRALEGPMETVGRCSFEIFIVHCALFKVVPLHVHLDPTGWMLLILGCLALGRLYAAAILWTQNAVARLPFLSRRKGSVTG